MKRRNNEFWAIYERISQMYDWIYRRTYVQGDGKNGN